MQTLKILLSPYLSFPPKIQKFLYYGIEIELQISISISDIACSQ